MRRMFLLHTPFTGLTGRVLANILGCRHGSSIDNPRYYDYILRWGNSEDVGYAPKVINRKQAIALSSNKLNMLRAFRACGVKTPRFWSHQEFGSVTSFPVIVRYRSHTQGQNFYVCNNRSELEHYRRDGYHALEVIKKHNEYRVFIWNGQVLEVNRKHRDEDEAPPAMNEIIRNYKNGWWFKVVTIYPPEIITEALKAVRAVGLHFGAVDICSTEAGGVCVFEVNSAPGLIARKAEMVAAAIKGSLERGEL